MKRLFVAVPVAEGLKSKLKPLLQELPETEANLKIVSFDNLHFTLKFVGDVDESKIPEIVEKLSLIRLKPFFISLRGVGVFPSAERMKVVWVGIESAELISLMKEVNRSLHYIRKEEHEEKPHLTIARVKSGKNKEKLQKLAEKYKNTSFGEMVIDKIILYESELGKEGPKYTIIKEFEFSK